MSVDDRTEPAPLSFSASDCTVPEGERRLAERLRRAAGQEPAEPSTNDTDPSSFAPEPTPAATTMSDEHAKTLVDPERTEGSAASMENAPELVAALAQFSGRALQEAKFQAASDGRGAARYDGVAVPAKSLGGAEAHAAEVIIATTPSARVPAVAAPEGSPAMLDRGQGRAEPDAPLRAPASVASPSRHRVAPRARERTTIPGLRPGSSRRSRALPIVLVALTVLLAVGLAYAFGFSRPASTPATTSSAPTSARPPEALTTLPPTVSALAPQAPAPEPSVASTATAPLPAALPTGDRRAVAPASANRAPPPALSSTARPSASSVRPSTTLAPVTPSEPKREPPAKSDFVW